MTTEPLPSADEEAARLLVRYGELAELAGALAHEIRNPLTVMKMLYHSLDLKFPPGDPRTEDARVMEEKIQQLNRIVERILDFARTAEPEIDRKSTRLNSSHRT